MNTVKRAFRHLLVPVDHTPASRTAVPLARTIARSTHAKVTFVHVGSKTDCAHKPDECTRSLRRSLSRVIRELRSAGIDAEFQVRGGSVVPEILAAIQAQHADCVVMATRGRRFTRVLSDSISGTVIARSKVPTVVVRPGSRRVNALQLLLVPVDGTPGGSMALDEAIGLARQTAATLVLLRVVRPLPGGASESLLRVNMERAVDAQELASADTFIDDLLRRMCHRGLVCTGRVLVGQPGATIAATARRLKADMIIMSTHGYVAPLRALFGSTADEVVRSSASPVLVVRRREV